ncbi:oligopeptide/dipeptide ABC transporter ATP-binding protein [Mesorhizobium soli]|uniref:ABC transporter ATP-binding protein n=1 Tax=Pseudaminobacter soli (ex Li et al. 2025) TaxID=1295366 RepID=UPI00247347E3|nr:ABC transporter ATP-binding protein [Mesorhizobium soli]MDH6234622.1 oligopeptide/dipeptide ABC transporter ATP-binding protein [Mesorhizobium soli]
MPEAIKLLQVSGLRTEFRTPAGAVQAVRGVSFGLDPGETVGIVGESGSGKSVTALTILRLIKSPPGRISAGSVKFRGIDLLAQDDAYMRSIRGNRISMIFQEPMTSLNPLMTVGDQLAEVMQWHQNLSRREGMNRAIELLRKVQIPSPEKRVRDYPHHMSGGMRQRVMIAIALACDPAILIADEPTTALDVTIQSQIMDLMLGLKDEFGSAVLMITHDLGVIAEMAQRVIVMYAGQVVEAGSVYEIFDEPLHPYTQALLRSVPKLGSRTEKGRHRLQEIPGLVASLINIPDGCAFRERCRFAGPECNGAIELQAAGDGRMVRCIKVA